MSLSIPFVLESVVETTPDSTLDVAGTTMSVTQLSNRVQTVARLLADSDEAKRGELLLPALDENDGLVRALAASTIGLLLVDVESDRSATTGDARMAPDQVWSQTPWARVEGTTYKHGDVAESGRRAAADIPPALAPVAELVATLARIGMSTAHDAI